MDGWIHEIAANTQSEYQRQRLMPKIIIRDILHSTCRVSVTIYNVEGKLAAAELNQNPLIKKCHNT